jgi:hypothetical protein
MLLETTEEFKRLIVTRVRDAKIIFNFFCYKNVCFELMNWMFEFIDISLILTLNDDILKWILNNLILTKLQQFW